MEEQLPKEEKESRVVLPSFATSRSRMDAFWFLLCFMGLISCSYATTDTEDRPKVYNVTCKSGFALLNLTKTESCDSVYSCRILDENEKVCKYVHENVKTVSVLCNSSIYCFKVDDKVQACYILTNETTPLPPGAIYDEKPPNRTHLFLFIPMSLIFIVVMLLFVLSTVQPPATSYEMAPMNDAVPPVSSA